MTDALQHRGPDSSDQWIDEHSGIALGHRRLAIVDLSAAGRQPMHSPSGRYVICYNGEVYNFRNLRTELEGVGCQFRGGSDTEVMLAAIGTWGIEKALRRFVGMFAFALWDTVDRTLHLARDRIGKKPLHVALVDKSLVFASELKAITAIPGFRRDLNEQAARRMVETGWVPDHLCIWQNVFKLAPGSLLSIASTQLAFAPSIETLQAQTKYWWSLADSAADGRSKLFEGSDQDAVSRLDDVLRVAVRERMVADVPLGAFLSGGVDSAAVVSLMQAQSAKPIRTFTIAFGEKSFDESTHASAVARHLGTEHTELRVTPHAALDVIPELPRIWDEPFADESQIPTLLVSRLARQHVKVVLSGDGGDECFAGYTRHYMAQRLARFYKLNPSIRHGAVSLLSILSGGRANSALRRLPLSNHLHHALRADKLKRLTDLLDAENADEMLDRLSAGNSADVTDLGDVVSTLILRDMTHYLPGDILVKLDRATMAASLEGRCPLLDHRVIEYSWRLPTHLKVRHGTGKWILRDLLRRYVPDRLINRPKQGFDVPIGAWLRGPLRDWASDHIAMISNSGDGIIDRADLHLLWKNHLAGYHDHSRELWPILMFQSWTVENLKVGLTPNPQLQVQSMHGA